MSVWQFKITVLLLLVLTGLVGCGGGNSNVPQSFEELGFLPFAAYDDTTGRELWRTDGTESGTRLIKDIHTYLNSGSFPDSFILYKGEVYFTADNGSSFRELWKTDGTAAGTKMVKDIHPVSSSYPRNLSILNDKLVFLANDGTSYIPSLWTTDGTEDGTRILVKLSTLVPPLFLYENSFTTFNHQMFFTVLDSGSLTNNEIWRTDGTVEGTKPIKKGVLSLYTIFNSEMYFVCNDETYGAELWKTDGTETGTVLVKDINPGVNWGNISNLIVMNDSLYFLADDGGGRELWMTDGTESGTIELTGAYPASLQGGIGLPLNNVAYFTGQTGDNDNELWKIDGNNAGATSQIKDINPGSSASSPAYYFIFNGEVYFTTLTYDSGLWKTDGTEMGTNLIKDIDPDGPSAGFVSGFATFNGELFFSANDGITGPELWKTDGTDTGTVLVKDINPGSYGSLPSFN